jgi:hypothetical protein
LIEQLAQTWIAVRLIKFRPVVMQVCGKLVPSRGIKRDAAELLHTLPHFVAKHLVGPVAPRKADNMTLFRQQVLLRQRVERWQNLAMRQIARGAEDNNRKRREWSTRVIHICAHLKSIESGLARQHRQGEYNSRTGL